jgi:hypothetical protein
MNYKTRKQKIDVIYEKIADKTLSFGCRVLIGWIIDVDGNYSWDEEDIIIENLSKVKTIYYSIFEWDIISIIWHPVMIWDVLDFYNKIWKYTDAVKDLIHIDIWKKKRKPIEEQSNECINLVYSLIN